MDHEPYRVLSHTECIAEVHDFAAARGAIVRTEYKLPDGRRADVIWLAPDGTITIVEVKHLYRSSLAAMAWDKYFRWCDYLWLAVPALGAADMPRHRIAMCDFPSSDRVGVLGVYPASVAVYHEPREHRFAADRRALVLAGLTSTNQVKGFV